MKAKLSLSERAYQCGAYGLVMDRDLNTVENILVAWGSGDLKRAWGGHKTRRRQGRRQTVMKCEPSNGTKPYKTWDGRPRDRPAS
ncbi:hypothetical protein JS539_07100 [Bifidobacterium simiarum]|nr:hypothetical protein [Bifidobacterium simiarum]